jgi:two-component system alkaline phosphatase synthesis response regulator PhoP
MKSYRILVVEDDVNILMGLEDNLMAEGYEVITAAKGDHGLEIGLNQNIHLVLLDIMLPVLNGYQVCKKLREQKPALPIIMLTARGSEVDKVIGLDYGADDYITKPFNLAVLLARIRAVLRRAYPEKETWTRAVFKDIEIDFKAMKTSKNGKGVKLTTKEYDIMRFFISHRGEVVHRHDLLNEVWGYKKTPSTRTVDNFILDLRKKLEPHPSRPTYITSISGVGYRFEPEVAFYD